MLQTSKIPEANFNTNTLSLPDTRIWIRCRGRAKHGIEGNFKNSHADEIYCSFCPRVLQKECWDQNNYFAKVDGSTHKSRDDHLSRPRRPFWILQVVTPSRQAGQTPRISLSRDHTLRFLLRLKMFWFILSEDFHFQFCEHYLLIFETQNIKDTNENNLDSSDITIS